jgi:hypothetical protein
MHQVDQLGGRRLLRLFLSLWYLPKALGREV